MHTNNRWAILTLLFAVRLSMAFQYQSVAAISPLVMNQFGVGLADIGLLIGLYLAPGLVIALPGGEIGRRYGDKLTVLFGLALMVGGGLTMVFASAWPWQLVGRLLAGVGGVLLNVLMSKMVTDWFVGKEIATAMAIFVNSWPVGLALALIALPPLAAVGGVAGVYLATSAFPLLGLLLMALFYRAPLGPPGATGAATWPAGVALRAVLAAGCIWGLYNAALVTVFGFGTAMLTERGWSSDCSRFGHQLNPLAIQRLRTTRWHPGRPNRPTYRGDAWRLRSVCCHFGYCRADRIRHPFVCRPRPCQRNLSRPHHESSCPNSESRNESRRHGDILHDPLRAECGWRHWCGEDCIHGWDLPHCVRCRGGNARWLRSRLLDVQEGD